MNESIFDKLDFGPLKPLLDNDDITDISYCNAGQIWVRSLTQGSIRVEIPGCTPEFMEKLAFQCSNVMGTTFNNAKPFLDAESSELRLNFVHESIATNGIACVIRKTPAKIRLEKEKLLKEDYFTVDIHDLLIKCVEGHCNVIVAGETGSGKTEFVKYLASHTRQTEKIITIEDTLELHLDKIFPQRDIVAMKTNNVASYTDVLVTCMRQNPKWILLSEVRSAEAVTAVRNSISSGHNILSTIHADKASAIPYRLYSLMETDIDVDQFLTTIYRYIQLGVHIKAYYSKKYGKFHREVDEVVEFYVDDDNVPRSHTIYRKMYEQEPIISKPSEHLIEYLENQNIDITSILNQMPEEQGEGSGSENTPVSNEEENNNQVEETPQPVEEKVDTNAIPNPVSNQVFTETPENQAPHQQPDIPNPNPIVPEVPTIPAVENQTTGEQVAEENNQEDQNNPDDYFGGTAQAPVENNQVQPQVNNQQLTSDNSQINAQPEQTTNNFFSEFMPKPLAPTPVENTQNEVVNNNIPAEANEVQQVPNTVINTPQPAVFSQTNLVQNNIPNVAANQENVPMQQPLSPEIANFFPNNGPVDDTNKTSTSINDIAFGSINNDNQNM